MEEMLKNFQKINTAHINGMQNQELLALASHSEVGTGYGILAELLKRFMQQNGLTPCKCVACSEERLEEPSCSNSAPTAPVR